MSLPDDYLEQLRALYPSRDGDNGWHLVRTLVPRLVHTHSISWERILAGTKTYRAHCDKTGKTGTELVKQAKTFYGPQMCVEEWADMMPVKSAHEIATERRWADLKAQAAKAGFRDPLPQESPEVYATQLRMASPVRDMSSVTQLAARMKA